MAMIPIFDVVLISSLRCGYAAIYRNDCESHLHSVPWDDIFEPVQSRALFFPTFSLVRKAKKSSPSFGAFNTISNR